MLELRHTYNLPLRDENVRKMSAEQWKAFVNNVIREEAFTQLRIHCANNKKTCHLHYESFSKEKYIEKLQPYLARVIFKAKTRMFDIKVNFKRNITLMFGVPFAKGKMRLLTIFFMQLWCILSHHYTEYAFNQFLH